MPFRDTQDPPQKPLPLKARSEVIALTKERLSPVNASEVRAALEAILESQTFAKVERPSRFFKFLVEMTLRGETDRLKETVLGVEIFGRPPDWDPRLDAIVRQEASRLRKRLARYYDSAGNHQPVRIDLPVGTYVPQFVRCEPSSTAIPTPAIETHSEKSTSPARLYLALAALVGLGLLGLLVRRVWIGRTLDPTSVAVLPFSNLSADPANQYFADGLTDEITDLLARNKMLRVVARSSASQFNAKAADIADVGRKLKVANIVEGSVERSGNRVKIIAHLARTSDGSYLWSNTFERQASDLFTVQSELAAAIAGSLKASSGFRAAQPHVPQAGAIEWFMKGRHELQQNTLESVT
jgi:TolB-like protein